MRTISLAFMGKNNETIIGRLLDSVGKSCDEWCYLDTGGTDRTVEIVKEKAEQYGIPLKMGAFEWVSDFAKARNALIPLCTQEWMLWLDTDDILHNGEMLHSILDNLPPKIGAVGLKYEYGYDEFGNCVTELWRERLVDLRLGWEWKNDVHEVLSCKGETTYANNTQTWVEHRPVMRQDENILRNTEILHRQHKENPTNARVVMYLGFQYFAQSKFDAALPWFEKALTMPLTEADSWEVISYISRTQVELGNLEQGMAQALACIALQPEWADPYFLMSRIHMLKEEWDHCVWWFEVGKKAIRPLHMLYINPLEYEWLPYVNVHLAYFHLGKFQEALECVEAALKVRKDPEMEQAREVYTATTKRVAFAENMAKTMKLAEPGERLEMFKTMPRGLLVVEDLRDVILPDVRANWLATPSGGKRIFFICGRVYEPWAPHSLNEGGIGGSETAVIHMAKQLAALGHHVTVFNEPGVYEGVHDGVGYLDLASFKPDMECDLLVGWRFPDIVDMPNMKAKQKWLWCHDLHYRDLLTNERATKFDRIMPVSKWHAGYMKRLYPFLGDNVAPTTNGIDPARFARGSLMRDPRKIVYLSSPDRGLGHLLEMWKYIRSVPGVSLHIYYGFGNLEKLARAGVPMAIDQMKTFRRLLDQPNITVHGRVGQQELADELLTAGIWAYPSRFLEVSCISAMECMAAGLAAVTTELGALPETMGDWGIRIDGWPDNATYQRQFMSAMGALLMDSKYREEVAQKGKTEPPTWAQVAEEWNRWLV